VTHGNRTSNRFALQCVRQIVNGTFIVVIEDPARTRRLDILEVLWRGRSKDFVASSNGELNGVTASTCGNLPTRLESCRLASEVLKDVEVPADPFGTCRRLRSTDPMA